MSAARRWLAASTVAVAGVVAVGATGPDGTGVRRHLVSGSLPVTSTEQVCPFTGGDTGSPAVTTIASVGGSLTPPLTGPTTVETRPLGVTKSTPSAVPNRKIVRDSRDSASAVTVVTATGARAAAIVASQQRLNPGGVGRALLSTPCIPPATDSWIVGADGRIGFDDLLTLANPGTSTANLTVTGWSSTGVLDPPKLRSYALAAGDAVTIPIGDVAPDKAWVTLHVHANSGRVAVALREHRIDGIKPGGADWVAPVQPPATDLVVPGFGGGAGSRRLYLTNPQDTDATVMLRLSTATGNFAPAGHATVLVRAGRSATVDLTEAFGDLPGAVILHSDRPVVAAGMVRLGGGDDLPDIQWQPSAPALTGAAVLPDNTPPFDQTVRIFLTAPTAASSVRIIASDGSDITVTVPRGRTVTVAPVQQLGTIARGPLVLLPAGDGPVFAARTLFAAGAHGPLVSSSLPTVLPGSVQLPAVRPDPRAAAP